MSHLIVATQLKRGEIAKIIKFTNEKIASKLLSMGVLPGSPIQLVRRAPFHGAYYVKIDGYNFALRAVEATTILVEIKR